MQTGKNVIKLTALVILLFCGVYCFYSSNIKNDSLYVRKLVIHNIEALASDEGINYACIGQGDIDCYGEKVKWKAEGLSLGY